MGWTYTYRGPNVSALDFFKERFDSDNEHAKHTVLAVSASLRTAYIALHIEYKDGRKAPFVLGVVCLTDWRKHDYYNFGYKDMSEEMGLYETRCPRRILDLLTPPEQTFTGEALERSREWRAACEANLTKRKSLKLKPGMILRTTRPIQFLWEGLHTEEFDTFICTDAKRLRFDALFQEDFREYGGRLSPVERRPVKFRNRRPLLEATVLTCEWWEVFDGKPAEAPPTEQAEASQQV